MYQTNELVKKLTRVASIVEAEGYIEWPRLRDTIEYAKGMDYHRLRLAIFVGLHIEAQRVYL
jgi:uncharacterized metal-binding protein